MAQIRLVVFEKNAKTHL